MVVPLSRADHQHVTHPFATFRPEGFLVRLACVKHTASVHPEPGSNSPFDSVSQILLGSLPSDLDGFLIPKHKFVSFGLSLLNTFSHFWESVPIAETCCLFRNCF